MDSNSTQQYFTMPTDSPKSSTSLSVSKSQPTNKPIFITLQKTGNGFTFAKPSITAVSKIPKLSSTVLSTARLGNSVGPGNQDKIVKTIRTLNIHGSQLTRIQHKNQYQTKNQLDTDIAITAKNVSNRPSNCNRKTSVASASIAISKQKLVKRTYKRKQPNQSSTTSKFIFPLPPPKIDFKVSTITSFTTAIDSSRKDEQQRPATLSLGARDETDHEDDPIFNGSGTGTGDNGVPSNCTLFRKLKIDTGKRNKSQASIRTDSINSEVQDSPKTFHNFSNVELGEVIGSCGTDDFASQSQTTSEPVTESVGESSDMFSAEHLTEPVNDKTYGDIIQRLDRMEALQIASAKRDSQILVAVKKLCLAYTKHNSDNDEIKKLLPMNDPIKFDAMDTQLIEDPVLLEKFRAYIRGFKNANDPDNFSSLLSVIMTDELVDQFNLKGILGKNKLQGYKVIEIIQDLHKPMDAKIFEKRMRTTIELAKNRYHNEQYRKRQLQIKQRHEHDMEFRQ